MLEMTSHRVYIFVPWNQSLLDKGGEMFWTASFSEDVHFSLLAVLKDTRVFFVDFSEHSRSSSLSPSRSLKLESRSEDRVRLVLLTLGFDVSLCGSKRNIILLI